jgi:hypothetical protein
MVPFGEPKSLIGSDGGCVSPFVWRTLAEARLEFGALLTPLCVPHYQVEPGCPTSCSASRSENDCAAGKAGSDRAQHQEERARDFSEKQQLE